MTLFSAPRRKEGHSGDILNPRLELTQKGPYERSAPTNGRKCPWDAARGGNNRNGLPVFIRTARRWGPHSARESSTFFVPGTKPVDTPFPRGGRTNEGGRPTWKSHDRRPSIRRFPNHVPESIPPSRPSPSGEGEYCTEQCTQPAMDMNVWGVRTEARVLVSAILRPVVSSPHRFVGAPVRAIPARRTSATAPPGPALLIAGDAATQATPERRRPSGIAGRRRRCGRAGRRCGGRGSLSSG